MVREGGSESEPLVVLPLSSGTFSLHLSRMVLSEKVSGWANPRTALCGWGWVGGLRFATGEITSTFTHCWKSGAESTCGRDCSLHRGVGLR